MNLYPSLGIKPVFVDEVSHFNYLKKLYGIQARLTIELRLHEQGERKDDNNDWY